MERGPRRGVRGMKEEKEEKGKEGENGMEGGGAPGGRTGIAETVDSLISHMNASRRLYTVLIATAFIIAPASITFALVMLLPDIATEVGPDYEISVEFDPQAGDMAGEYFGLPPDHTIAAYSGPFTGKMLGHHIDEDGEFLTSAGPREGERGEFYGEFVGEFDGEHATLAGEMFGTFTGDVHSIIEEGIAPEWKIDEHLYYVSIGVYEGRFDGNFSGMFFGASNATAMGERIEGYSLADYLEGDHVQPYSVTYVPEEPPADGADGLYEPRFMAFESDAGGNRRHADVTVAITVFTAVVTVASVVMLYVGLREMSFYRRWGKRFERYLRDREEVERELAGAGRHGYGDGAAGDGEEGGPEARGGPAPAKR